jgi:actin-related protein 7
MTTENPVVIDLGSESIKAGYASQVPSEHEPRIVTPSLVTVNARGVRTDPSAQQQHHRVIDRGFIANWDHLEAMLHYLFYEQLGWVIGEEGSALFVEPLFVGKSEREQLVQLLFERFNVMGVFVHDAAVLSQFAAGKLSGCTVDIGHGKIDVATVSEGTTNAPGAVRLSFAGEQLTQLLGQLLQQQQQQSLQQQPSLQQLNGLKVQCCRAAASADAYRQLLTQQQQGGSSTAAAAAGSSQAPDGVASQQPGAPEEFTLPDGAKFTVTTEGYQVTEALFDPTLLGHHTPGDCMLRVTVNWEVLGTRSNLRPKLKSM